MCTNWSTAKRKKVVKRKSVKRWIYWICQIKQRPDSQTKNNIKKKKPDMQQQLFMCRQCVCLPASKRTKISFISVPKKKSFHGRCKAGDVEKQTTKKKYHEKGPLKKVSGNVFLKILFTYRTKSTGVKYFSSSERLSQSPHLFFIIIPLKKAVQ